MPLAPGPHLELLHDALAAEAEGQRLLLAGQEAAGAEAMLRAAALYRSSWEAAPPASYGRLIGMLKASIIGGQASEPAAYVITELQRSLDCPAQTLKEAASSSAAASYALALAALVRDEDTLAGAAADGMRTGSPAFQRAAAAIAALAERDPGSYAAAVGAILADFEGREQHLTGVAIADTALMLEQLADARGMAARPRSPLLPANG